MMENQSAEVVLNLIEEHNLRDLMIKGVVWSFTGREIIVSLLTSAKLKCLGVGYRFNNVQDVAEFEGMLEESGESIRPIIKSLNLELNFLGSEEMPNFVDMVTKMKDLEELSLSVFPGFPEIVLSKLLVFRSLQKFHCCYVNDLRLLMVTDFITNTPSLREVSLLECSLFKKKFDVTEFLSQCTRLTHFRLQFAADNKLAICDSDLSDFLLSGNSAITHFNGIVLMPDRDPITGFPSHFVLSDDITPLDFNFHLLREMIRLYPDVYKLRIGAPHASYAGSNPRCDIRPLTVRRPRYNGVCEDTQALDKSYKLFLEGGYHSTQTLVFKMDAFCRSLGGYMELNLEKLVSIVHTKTEFCWMAEEFTKVLSWHLPNLFVLEKVASCEFQRIHLSLQHWENCHQLKLPLLRAQSLSSLILHTSYWDQGEMLSCLYYWNSKLEGLKTLGLRGFSFNDPNGSGCDLFVKSGKGLKSVENLHLQDANIRVNFSGTLTENDEDKVIELPKKQRGRGRKKVNTFSFFDLLYYERIQILAIEDSWVTLKCLESVKVNFSKMNNLKRFEFRNVFIVDGISTTDQVKFWHKFLLEFLELANSSTFDEIEEFTFFPANHRTVCNENGHIEVLVKLLEALEEFIGNKKSVLKTLWVWMLPRWPMVADFTKLFLPLLDVKACPQLKYLFGCALDRTNNDCHLRRIRDCHYASESWNQKGEQYWSRAGSFIYPLLVAMYQEKRIQVNQKLGLSVFSFLAKNSGKQMSTYSFEEGEKLVFFDLLGRKKSIEELTLCGHIYEDQIEPLQENPKFTLDVKNLTTSNLTLQNLNITKTIASWISGWNLLSLNLSNGQNGISQLLAEIDGHKTLKELKINREFSSAAKFDDYLANFIDNSPNLHQLEITRLSWSTKSKKLFEAIQNSQIKTLTLNTNPSIEPQKVVGILTPGKFDEFTINDVAYCSKTKKEVCLSGSSKDISAYTRFYSSNSKETSLTLRNSSLFSKPEERSSNYTLFGDLLKSLPTITSLSLHCCHLESLSRRELPKFLKILTHCCPQVTHFEFLGHPFSQEQIKQIIEFLLENLTCRDAKDKNSGNYQGPDINFGFDVVGLSLVALCDKYVRVRAAFVGKGKNWVVIKPLT
mmetsp:Transcript_37169/g.42212  ORF Transcript_37169/g.42212 Transcript_37169/m.42212 type:complete len:1122 (-) Transcript_37169:202-3567(-)